MILMVRRTILFNPLVHAEDETQMRVLLISSSFLNLPKKTQSSTSIYKKTTESYSSSTWMRMILGPRKTKERMWTWMKPRKLNLLLYSPRNSFSGGKRVYWRYLTVHLGSTEHSVYR